MPIYFYNFVEKNDGSVGEINMPIEQKIFFYTVAGLLFLFNLILIRKRRMRENFTLLWLFISFGLIVIVLGHGILVQIADFFGANATSLIMFCGMVALLLLILQLTIMNSSQATQIKDLAQKIALLEGKFKKDEKKD